jgi:hypothetical protein
MGRELVEPAGDGRLEERIPRSRFSETSPPAPR